MYAKLKMYLFFFRHTAKKLNKISLWVSAANFECMSCQCSETEMNGTDFK